MARSTGQIINYNKNYNNRLLNTKYILINVEKYSLVDTCEIRF
jgi:hypothetical protein